MASQDLLDDALDSTLSPPQAGAPVPPHDILDDALSAMQAGAPGPQATAAPANPYNWTRSYETGNALMLGGGKYARAGIDALRALPELLQNKNYDHVPLGDLFNMAYSSNLDKLNSAQHTYQSENPGASLVSDLLGGALPTAAAMAAGQEYAVAPLARGLAGLAPKAAPVVDFLTGTLPSDAGWLAKAASRAFTGTVGGATAGGLQAGLSPKPFGEQVGTGAVTGAALGPVIGAAVDSLASHVLPRVADQANRLMARGVELKAGQLPGAGPITSWLHRNLSDASGAPQRTQLTQALSRTFGENSPVIDNGLISKAESRIGGMFEKFGNATIQKDPQLADSIVNTLADAHGAPGNGTGIPEDKLAALRDVGALIANAGDRNTIPGSVYLNLTKRGSTLDRLTRDPDVGVHAAELRDALDGALERSVTGAGGRWVPAGQAGGSAPAGATAIPQPNALISAPSGARAQPLLQSTQVAPPGPAIGVAGPGKTTPPRMVWEIDPATQGALKLLQDARGQYKNLMIARGLTNDATGEIQPSALANRVARFYPPNRYSGSNPTEWERSIKDLAPASQFIPNGPGGAKPPNKLMQFLQHGSAAGLGIAGEHLLSHASDDLLGALAGGAGLAGAYGVGKLAGKALDSTMAARAIIANAQRAPTYGAALSPNLLLTPPVVQAYNRERNPK